MALGTTSEWFTTDVIKGTHALDDSKDTTGGVTNAITLRSL
jgi:hypothetical protein